MKLNFNEVKRPTLDIVLNDKEQTAITLVSPIKSTAQQFKDIFENLANKNTKDIVLDDLYEICSKLLSYNLENKAISLDKVKEIFSLDDIILLLKTYQDFLYGIDNSKN